MGILIKMDDFYYDASTDSYDTVNQVYNSIGDNVSDIQNLLSISTLSINNLFKEIVINDEIFKPIEKFDNFKIISPDNDIIALQGIKSNIELVVASDDIMIKSDVVNQINYYSLDSIGDIRVVFSIDKGVTWLSYIDDGFTTLSCSIPLKDYSTLTSNELELWNIAIEEIKVSGMNKDTIPNVDWKVLDFTTIRFAYVLERNSISEISEVNDLILNFDAKGHLRKMKKSEYDALLYDYGLHVQPLIDSPIIKLNALLRETDKNVNTDTRKIIDTPVLTIDKVDNLVVLNWSSIDLANSYKVYVNGVLIENTINTTSNYIIDKEEDMFIFCVRAYPNDITTHKPSNYSNMEIVDYSGYLARVNESADGHDYVGVKVGNEIFKFKVKNSII